MNKCKFEKAWVGLCNEETENSLCEEHSKRKCCSCGEQATRECSETAQFVCGFPLCNDCEHTIQSNGCNSGGELPKGLKFHCRKDEQVYKSWMMRKDDTDIFVDSKGVLERGEQFTATIDKLNITGKWVEFWFEEDFPRILNDSTSYHQSSKLYKLRDAVEKAGMMDKILNKGYCGKKITWEKVGPNYEIKSISGG